jgi:hypothetical protein
MSGAPPAEALKEAVQAYNDLASAIGRAVFQALGRATSSSVFSSHVTCPIFAFGVRRIRTLSFHSLRLLILTTRRQCASEPSTEANYLQWSLLKTVGMLCGASSTLRLPEPRSPGITSGCSISAAAQGTATMRLGTARWLQLPQWDKPERSNAAFNKV